ncbi:MAG: hypothetical protein ACFFFH_00815 [Candidatus Thorarchaeota archaeon]
MLTLVKTVILPLDPATNRKKIQHITRLARRYTFAFNLFLQEARSKNVSSKKVLKQFRHKEEIWTDLSLDLQVCRDRPHGQSRPRKKTNKWKAKVIKRDAEL